MAQFKYNMRPFVDKAKSGETVVVTCDGKDEFQVLPLSAVSAPPVFPGLIDPKAFEGIDLDEPAFESWK